MSKDSGVCLLCLVNIFKDLKLGHCRSACTDLDLQQTIPSGCFSLSVNTKLLFVCGYWWSEFRSRVCFSDVGTIGLSSWSCQETLMFAIVSVCVRLCVCWLQVRVNKPNVFIHKRAPVTSSTVYSEVNHTNIILLQSFFKHSHTPKHFLQGSSTENAERCWP